MERVKVLLAFLKRKYWYIMLLFFSSIYVWNYRDEIHQLKELNAQNLIFLLWLLLLLLPLFSEMEIFGVKLKKEVEQSKREIKDSISELKSQIVDMKINNSLVNSQPISIYTSQLPTDKEVKQTLEDFTKSSEEYQDEESNIDDFVSDSSTYLFKVRLTLEKIIRGLCERLDFTGIYNMSEMMKCVLKSGIIDKKTFDHLRQIIEICNRGVHGEIVSDEYVKLVQVLLPQVIKDINATTHRMGYKYYIVCPKCRFTGHTNIENECPKCGSVFVDD